MPRFVPSCPGSSYVNGRRVVRRTLRSSAVGDRERTGVSIGRRRPVGRAVIMPIDHHIVSVKLALITHRGSCQGKVVESSKEMESVRNVGDPDTGRDLNGIN
ncbi:hypothetical protein AOLI_G00148310 [Acnodon oligacanthus]